MKDTVQSVTRSLSILEVLSEFHEGLGITDIAQKVGLHKSTVYRLLSTLIQKEFVIQDKETNKYKTTFKLYELGNKRIKHMDILSASKAYSKKLMESVNEVVHLVVRDDHKIVYIDKVEANNTIRMASYIGNRSPMHCTSVGKAILAYLPEKKVEEIWNKSKAKKLTANTITDLSRLTEELVNVRSKGFAVDDEENEEGVRCIGAPIFNRNAEVEGAISVSGPAIRMSEEKMETVAIEVMKYAGLISRELGYMKV
jgi:IclR family KDG regulon transcriptional repressor